MRTDLPSVLHSSLELVDDARGVDIVEFLVAKKADINRQVNVIWANKMNFERFLVLGLHRCISVSGE